jgi:hypothetical protein
MGWFRKLLGRDKGSGRPQGKSRPPQIYPWWNDDWWVAPKEPRVGQWSGTLGIARVRTWAGCCMVPAESIENAADSAGEEAGDGESTLAVLQIDDGLVPLKWAPRAPGQRDAMERELLQWKPKPDTIGSGPPYCRDADPLLTPNDVSVLGVPVGELTTVTGFWFPMFQAGTVFGFQVWGLYIEPRSPR